jgi:uncharacterized membrane-anchored protein YhcB (DUF1043 family)
MPVAKRNLLQKIADAQDEMDNPKKRADNPHFKSKFASLADTMDVIETALGKHKIGHLFVFEGTSLTYRVYDLDSDEVVISSLDISILMEGLSGNVWQQMGQSFTYLRRYLSQAFWNLVPEDTDAQDAPSRPAAQRATKNSDNAVANGSNSSDGGVY